MNSENLKDRLNKLIVRSISCPNPDCGEVWIAAEWFTCNYEYKTEPEQKTVKTWSLHPMGEAKPLPADVGIPPDISSTFEEACVIASLSPKASAAMSRRCLQGIVRDFWKIPDNKRGNLGAELNYVKERIAPQTWDAIQAVRAVGDIGAHMDKYVDQIVDVEPGEASLMINLIYDLIQDWYVAAHHRAQRTSSMVAVADQKKQQLKTAKKERAKALAPPAQALPAPEGQGDSPRPDPILNTP